MNTAEPPGDAVTGVGLVDTPAASDCVPGAVPGTRFAVRAFGAPIYPGPAPEIDTVTAPP